MKNENVKQDEIEEKSNSIIKLLINNTNQEIENILSSVKNKIDAKLKDLIPFNTKECAEQNFDHVITEYNGVLTKIYLDNRESEVIVLK